MRIASYVMIWASEDVGRELFAILSKRARARKPSGSLQTAYLYIDSEDYRRLKDELHRRGVRYEERFCREFTKDELAGAEFLQMTGGPYCGYPQPEGSYRQLCYDLSTACPLCGNGARQKEPFRIRRTPPPNRTWVQLGWVCEYLVNDRMAALIQERGLTGCTFWPVLYTRKKGEVPGWRQLVFTHEVPPMAAQTHFPIVSEDSDPELERQFGQWAKNPPVCPCGKCGRNFPNAYDTPDPESGWIYYDRSSVAHFQDFNKSSEWLGGGYTTWQAKIVSHRVYQLLCELGLLRTTMLTPIRIV